MYGIKVVAGDIALNGDGNVKKVSGAERVKQELSHWLMEPLGTDPIYVNFGSTLWDSVGGIASSEHISNVREEVSRVVSNYVAYQRRQIKEDMAMGQERFMRNWDVGDIVESVNEIDVKAVADTVYITVKLTLANGTGVTVIQQS